MPEKRGNMLDEKASPGLPPIRLLDSETALIVLAETLATSRAK